MSEVSVIDATTGESLWVGEIREVPVAGDVIYLPSNARRAQLFLVKERRFLLRGVSARINLRVEEKQDV